jgi:hypothetical protein
MTRSCVPSTNPISPTAGLNKLLQRTDPFIDINEIATLVSLAKQLDRRPRHDRIGTNPNCHVAVLRDLEPPTLVAASDRQQTADAYDFTNFLSISFQDRGTKRPAARRVIVAAQYILAAAVRVSPTAETSGRLPEAHLPL